jgi:rhodanese-related sulfurtransferase
MHFVAVLLFAMLAEPAGHASQAKDASQTGKSAASESNALNAPGYCGLYALYRGTIALGRHAEFGEFLSPAYLGSAVDGSSVEQLMLAASNLGVTCRHVTHLNCQALKCVDSPTLLHVKSTPGSSVYDHWVLFLGIENEQAKICDGTQEPRLVDLRDISAGWDGHALVLEPSPGLHRSLVLGVMTPYLGLCAGALLLLAAVRWSGHRVAARFPRAMRFEWLKAGLQAIAVAALGLAMAGVFERAGFLSAPTAIGAIQEEKIGTFLPRVTTNEMARIAERREMVIVDARAPREFDAGHLPGALNIDSAASSDACLSTLHGVSKDAPIVVYCQSNGCPFSAHVARALAKCGFRNLRLFPGGWIEWQSHKGSQKHS